MGKRIKVSEGCIISCDEKGQRTLVGKAKEALTTMSKNKVDVVVVVKGDDKDAVEKFLKGNEVPFKEVVSWSELQTDDKDIMVVPSSRVVMYRGNWDWVIDDIVSKLYRKSDKPEESEKSEQEKMNDKWAEYKKWAEEANKHKDGCPCCG